MLNEKVVFILGAGFSSEAGAPLVDDFFIRAKDIYANQSGRLSVFDKECFKKVFDYQKKLIQAKEKIQFDVDNIEELFSFMDINLTYSKGEDIKRISEAKKFLIYLIIKTLDVSIDSDKYPTYFDFLENIYSYCRDFSFITFNYDLILERAFENGDAYFTYCTDEESQKRISSKKLLKLHGSANWILCSGNECGYLNILNVKATGDVYNQKCPKCRKSMIPLLIPPTWDKRFESMYIKNVWHSAFEELKNATYIVVIGYSLPPNDRYFRNFLGLALRDNLKLRRLVVIDKNTQVRTRYEDFLQIDFVRRQFSFIADNFLRLRLKEMIKGKKEGIAK